MLQLCSYETDALGYSSFCKLFTAEEFKNYEYYYDLSVSESDHYGLRRCADLFSAHVLTL